MTAGRHNFRWSYEKDSSGSALLDTASIDNVFFPTPQIAVQDVYDNPNIIRTQDSILHTSSATLGGARLTNGYTRSGDQNHDRQQGQIVISQNLISSASNVGLLIDAGPRDPNSNESPLGSARNLPTLSNDRLAPGVTLMDNVVANEHVQVLIPPDAGKRNTPRPGWHGGRYTSMREALATDYGGGLYRRRKAMVEPVFAQTKHNRRINQFQRRGRSAARSEWRLITATHNLLKLHRHQMAVAAA